MTHPPSLTAAIVGGPDLTGANCASADPEAFFVEKGGDTEPAKKVCAACPIDVRRQCLAYAIDNRVEYGVWGGLSPRERRKLINPDAANAELDAKRAEVRRLRDEGHTQVALAVRYGVTQETIRRWIKHEEAA